MDKDDLKSKDFGVDFKWGISSSAFQTEGFPDADGKEQSIWDTFTQTKGNIANGDTAEIACAHYEHYEKDIQLIKQLGIPCYRFSISWSRIIPKGTGMVNELGLAYYNNIIDCCIANNIEPWITLYHWDLPQALEDKGGWLNREIIRWFADYTNLCISKFGDRVKHWVVFNEPLAVTGAGYFLGIHAPGKTGKSNFLKATHNVVLAISESAKCIKNNNPNAEVGIAVSCSSVHPHKDLKKNIHATERVKALLNNLFIEPLTFRGYPFSQLPFLKGISKYMLPGDEQLMGFNWDFIGIQNYTREVVKRSWFTPYLGASIVKAKHRNVPHTLMGWEVYPAGIYEIIQHFQCYSKNCKLYITENGAAFADKLENGKINDLERINYLKAHLKQVKLAQEHGLKINGYFAWTLLDNFEWAEGFAPKFGLVHVNLKTQERTIKESGFWYKNFLLGR